MATSDSAFLWESEALRSSRAMPEREGQPDWITLREAHDQTGISVSTLRRWARKDLIPSYLEPYRDGQLRMVSKSAVVRRAADLGRVDNPSPQPSAAREQAPAPPPTSSTHSSARRREQPEDPPPGTMLIPIDAWDKMLMQLGNLHQAGQELAEARERAAKAETEVKFLKERLAEKRDTSPTPVPPSPPAEPRPSPRPVTREKGEPSPGGGKAKTPGFTRLMWRAWRTRPKD